MGTYKDQKTVFGTIAAQLLQLRAGKIKEINIVAEAIYFSTHYEIGKLSVKKHYKEIVELDSERYQLIDNVILLRGKPEQLFDDEEKEDD